MISQYGLANRFHFSGFTADIQSAYTAVDVLCFPSHYDAPGRPVFEAAFVGVPSIVAVRDPYPDTLINGRTGLAIFPQDFIGLASAIRSLATNRDWCQSLGQSARDLAHNNFDVAKNSKLLLELYRNCIVGIKMPYKIS
jgi:glycosyltransferase involved in cell wall biosynthesis